MKPKRVLVLGDVHSNYKGLLQVLERCNFNEEEDQLISLGDLVDGWGEGAEVVDYMIGLKERCRKELIYISSNHDTDFLAPYLTYGRIDPRWLVNGGQVTLDKYVKSGMIADPRHREFINSSHDYYIDDKNRLFVHGGFNYKNVVVGKESYRTFYYWDRSLWELAMSCHGSEVKPDVFTKGHSEIFIGHTSTEIWKVKPHYPEFKDPNQPKNGSIVVPMNRCNVWNLDTGSGWGGRLTIMDVDTKEYWQSDDVKELYSDEKGRF